MPAPSTSDELLTLVARSELLVPERLEEFIKRRRADNSIPSDMIKLAQLLIADGLLTKYQAEQILCGRWRNFIIGGKYKLLERLGKGGMAMVFLCEHQVMKRLVALKILPTAHAADKELLGRFHREARALSQLRHPNIVGAYDADHASKVHFLVMEYVDGGDLDQIIQRAGPLSWERAANYMMQAAHGLQHAHECGLVHRDIKPGNVLVDRSGIVKLLDLGLARIFHETTDDLTTGRDAKTLLGTVDYLAPEQALNSHDVDIRADIYSLGATFYFVLTGKGLFEDGTVAQKLSWHLHRPPTPIAALRPDVPPGLIAVIETMLAKKAEDRFQTPDEVVEALEPWTETAIDPPSPDELPQISRAARAAAPPSSVRMAVPLAKSSASMALKMSAQAQARSSRNLGPEPPPATSVNSGRSRAPEGREPAAPQPRGRIASTQPARQRQSTSTWWRKPVYLGALGAGMLVVVILSWWAFFAPSGGRVGGVPAGNDTGGDPAAPSSTSSNAASDSPGADVPADATFSLSSGSATALFFPSLREAILLAKPGDKVVVRGSLMTESLELSDVNGAPKDLTIEGINPRGKRLPVRWRAPRDLSAGKALLDVTGLEALKLRGFLFDGQGRVAELLRLSGRGAGTSLEAIQFEKASRADVVFKSWTGDSSRLATFQNVRFSTANEIEAAIEFETDPNQPSLASEWIKILSCRFAGPFQAALLVGGPVAGVTVEQCRFLGAIDGVRYHRTEAGGPLGLQLTNNTFVDLQKGIHFETTPPAASSELILSNNLFAGTPRIATLDKVSIEPAGFPARWIWTDETKKSPGGPQGKRHFRKVFDVTSVPDKATLDIGCDQPFTVWLNGFEVAKNPSPYFTQRVFAVDISKRLRRGKNVLAIQATNQHDRLDPTADTAAGLIAQVSTSEASKEVVLGKTDDTWKCSEVAPEAWVKAEFDDSAWTPARKCPEDGNAMPWKFAIWDSAVLPQLQAPLEPIKLTTSGNVRDFRSWEGYPTTESERVMIAEGALSKNPSDDATFLRYPRSYPLASFGPGGTSVGALDDR